MEREKKSDDSVPMADLEKSSIFSETIIANNKRLVKTFLFIFILANVLVTLIKWRGVGSQYLTYFDILIELVLATAILGISLLLANRFRGKKASGYITITGVLTSLLVFQYTFHGAPELFASVYISLALSVFYFDVRITVFTMSYILVTQILNPDTKG